MQRITAFVLTALIAVPAGAEESSFQLFDHFAIAQVAGEVCAERTEAEKAAFADKFEALAAITERDALEANADLDTKSFHQFSTRRRHNLQGSVFKFLDAEGCEHPEAKALVAKYSEFLELTLPE